MLKRSQPAKDQDRTEDGECQVYAVHADRVRNARAALLSDDVAEDVTELFKVLSHPTRVSILRALAQETLCVCDLAQVLELSISAVSHQLRDLRRLRLVEYRMDGRLAYYSIRQPVILSLLDQGIAHVSAAEGTP